MADQKISALPASTVPLAGTEVLPIVQSGSTKKVAVSDLTAGRSVAASNLRVGGATINYAATEIQQAVLGASRGIIVLGPAGNFTDGAVSIELRSTGTAIQGSNNATQIPLNLNPDGADVTIGANLVPSTAAKGVNFTANTPAAGMTSQLLNWYEEGTWTPTTAGDATGAFSSAEGVYTRVGNIVTATCFLIVSSDFTSNDIGGLPFACRAGFGGTSNNFISSVLTNSGTTAISAMVRGSDTKIGFFAQNAGTSHLPNTTNLSYRLTAVYMV